MATALDNFQGTDTLEKASPNPCMWPGLYGCSCNDLYLGERFE